MSIENMTEEEKTPQQKAEAIHKIIGTNKRFILITVDETEVGSSIETFHYMKDIVTTLGTLELAKHDILKK